MRQLLFLHVSFWCVLSEFFFRFWLCFLFFQFFVQNDGLDIPVIIGAFLRFRLFVEFLLKLFPFMALLVFLSGNFAQTLFVDDHFDDSVPLLFLKRIDELLYWLVHFFVYVTVLIDIFVKHWEDIVLETFLKHKTTSRCHDALVRLWALGLFFCMI